eukprot:TRINITY_DN5007_c0_g1_i1.p2 TRINITY_DN5007_c0_g1~~TRINITY_DN5007_c0_g1_i1.p2  ORF type:complete len:106 (+),score=17.28 TRINITY_DN5007_c0_g1_i1:211-528(+)
MEIRQQQMRMLSKILPVLIVLDAVSLLGPNRIHEGEASIFLLLKVLVVSLTANLLPCLIVWPMLRRRLRLTDLTLAMVASSCTFAVLFVPAKMPSAQTLPKLPDS